MKYKNLTNLLIAIIFGLIFNYLIIENIGKNFNYGDRLDYVLDGYYYWYLGSELHRIIGFQIFPLEIFEIAPTFNSWGVIYVSYMLSSIGIGKYTIPLILIFGIYLISPRIFNNKNYYLYLAIIFIYAPLMFITSKEYFVLIGIIFFIIAESNNNLSSSKILFHLMAIIALGIGRFELILFIYMAKLLSNYKINYLKIILMITFAIVILYINEGNLIEIIKESEFAATKEGVQFCHGVISSTCIFQNNNIVLLFIDRLIFSILIPIKWIGQLVLFYDVNDNYFSIYSKLSQPIILILVLFYFFKIYRDKRNKLLVINSVLLKTGIYFVVIYGLFYSLIVFHQPTRHYQLCLLIASVFLMYSVKYNHEA